ncbi:vesicle-associated membrane protein-like protein [Zopfia rhizophila CBS 207.26]|uniref:Synaptobrevin homolog YKT6 n=1 Tax=Zopfia rhizophila CBS 207.26 TaxID=1314779 RepID=A0A6A6EB18_9PEZI|nr:vesicle-associated membrane protein-like protein [Zopfia rhizophila CBS 207.26]
MASSSTATPLLYACIAHNTTILSEHTSSASSATSSIPSLILPKIQHSSPQKLTYTHGNYYIHYIASSPSEYSASQSSAGGLTYLTIAEVGLGRRIPFGFLVNAQKKFLDEFDPSQTDFASLPSYGCASFNSTLKKLMIEQGATQSGQQDALRTAQQEIDGVREIMTENIERVLERGERIDLLVDKTDRLGNNARDFRVRSRGLRRRMWWKNVKLMVLLVLVVIFLLYLFVGFGCGLPGWSRCIHHG